MRNIKDLQEIFVQVLTDLVIEKGINFAKLSKETGIPKPTLSCWKNMTRTPQIDSLYTLADYFGVSIDYLVGREV